MTIILYSREGCSPCKTLKYFLDKFKVDYKEFDIDVSEFMTAPTIVIGEHIVQGPNIGRVRELLNI